MSEEDTKKDINHNKKKKKKVEAREAKTFDTFIAGVPEEKDKE
jgi:hypothetical protein